MSSPRTKKSDNKNSNKKNRKNRSDDEDDDDDDEEMNELQEGTTSGDDDDNMSDDSANLDIEDALSGQSDSDIDEDKIIHHSDEDSSDNMEDDEDEEIIQTSDEENSEGEIGVIIKAKPKAKKNKTPPTTTNDDIVIDEDEEEVDTKPKKGIEKKKNKNIVVDDNNDEDILIDDDNDAKPKKGIEKKKKKTDDDDDEDEIILINNNNKNKNKKQKIIVQPSPSSPPPSLPSIQIESPPSIIPNHIIVKTTTPKNDKINIPSNPLNRLSIGLSASSNNNNNNPKTYSLSKDINESKTTNSSSIFNQIKDKDQQYQLTTPMSIQQQSIEALCSTYLYMFIKQRGIRKYEYTKTHLMDLHILQSVNKNWVFCIDIIGRKAIAAFTKTNTYLIVLNELKSGIDEYFVYPSVLKNSDSPEFISVGTWIREGVIDIFYPSDLYTYDKIELVNFTNPKEWELPNNHNHRLNLTIQDRYQKLNILIHNDVIIDPIAISNTNQFFQLKQKTIGTEKDGIYETLLKELETIPNHGLLCIEPSHVLNDMNYGHYIIHDDLYQTIDLLIYPHNKPIIGLPEYIWKPNMVDDNKNPIYPLFIKSLHKKYNTPPGCNNQHVVENIDFVKRGYVMNTIEGMDLSKKIIQQFNTMRDNIIPILVTCIIPPTNDIKISGLWLHKFKLANEPVDHITTMHTYEAVRENINLRTVLNTIFKK